MTSYPADRKKSGFAIRYVKAVMASDAIVLHGSDVIAFAVWIVSLEDKLHYSKPVSLWRADIQAKFNMHRNEAHSKLLKAAKDSGLVHQVERARGSREEMQFWVTVPDWLIPFFGIATGSEIGTSRPATGSENGTSQVATGSENGTRSGTSGGTSGGTLPIPYTHDPLNIAPKEKRFVPPSVSEVAQYANEIASNVDPENFVDHYQANGWRVGSNRMKCWRAAFRNWTKRTKAGDANRPELQPMAALS
jgi:hypothetical protein